MKVTIKSLSVAILCLASVSSFAQSKSISQTVQEKDGKLKVHVETTENGKKEVFERNYNVEGLSSEAKEKLVSDITDSLMAKADGPKAKIKMKIFADKDAQKKDDVEIHSFSFSDGDSLAMARPGKNMKRRIIIKKDGQTIERELNGDEENLNFNFDFKGMDREMQKKFKDFNTEEWIAKAQPRLKSLQDGAKNLFFFDGNGTFPGMSESKTIHGLRVYPNKPFDAKLNLRFDAPQKGNVTISVTDVNGKEVGHQVVKDFEGEFMGQVDLKKNTKGTLFVTVTQNEDGTVKRVVVE
ncbi:T9SS type A sorting domain-containing protein [Flectobacillus roseus]|uniref:T9SS type A sorting domain-containing protein n=1 Tax=Flectobacillus roseus TaxID=502259 RepID=UPI0024B812E5|nr:T9SS type A sorting domain-containing protein [Flectobacillus roseus]MDI9872364.1 T9SS type A sorting domain-containing protein [Flectobacillus roseus]